jgi:MFS transporter, LPLT family, lysophospholipid transporter
MKRGFYTIIAAQFFSSLADNALLIAAIVLLTEINEPAWMTPLLKLFFYISYVLLAPFVGAFADSMPKGRVMFITNLIKISGCFMMFSGLHPLLAYAVVGLGAAAYSPAKYGILTELLPPEQLVVANGWIEGSTVGSIILGVVCGGALVDKKISGWLLTFDFPLIDTTVNTAAEAAICVIALSYLTASAINLFIPLTGAVYAKQSRRFVHLIKDFGNCFSILWRDPQGQISLAVTTLFWGAGATLQFIVLEWAKLALNMELSDATRLQGAVALGVAVGAVLAGGLISMKKAFSVLSMGVLMGIIVALMVFVHNVTIAYILLIVIGGLSGFFVVPMNAMLQHRGHVLMSAGHSIAVQNFNENLSILGMLGIYALLIYCNVPLNAVIVAFGAFVAIIMWFIIMRHAKNQRHA